MRIHNIGMHEGIMKFICETCEYILAAKSDLRIHMNKEHGMMSKFECVYCGNIMKTRRDVRRHARWKHEGNLKKTDEVTS